ncbi:Re/Si-specific NAD(P)(+) transhydrogenase subunit alpha [Chitinibacteraceae bacterium HSL-7]
MQIAVPKERIPHETRVAATPETVKKLLTAGHRVVVEQGAGLAAAYADADYAAAGATLAPGFAAAVSGCDLVFKIRAPLADEVAHLPLGISVVAHFDAWRYAHFDALNRRRVTAYALERTPRITRAQSMDILSSQANLAGYRAVLLATQYYPRLMPMMMTAAGSVKPARVLVIGAGVAGLQAIATAKRLGAVVEVFDVRPATREQVESLGARFVEVELSAEERDALLHTGGYAREMSDDYRARQSALLARHAAQSDIIITTALIPGKAAPVLLPESTVREMRAGSVIVDMAVDAGGNCPLSRRFEAIQTPNGVTVVGHGNLPALLPTDASAMFARNLVTFLTLLTGDDAALAPRLDDEIVVATRVCADGALLAPELAAPASNAVLA